MHLRRPAAVAASLALLLPLAACGGGGGDEPGAMPVASPLATARPGASAAPEVSAEPSVSSQPVSPPVSPQPAPGETLPPVRDELSLAALMREDFPPSRIERVAVESRTEAYLRYRVTYEAGDLTVSGVLLQPHGEGPFPGIVLNHGYIDPDVYRPGQGLAREQDRLARAGFAVLHTDYRGHASSDDPTEPFDMESRLGYTRDAIHAVLALEQEPFVDPDRMAMLGRSMGGAVTLNALVVKPDLVEAAVIYASVSSLLHENVEHFTRPNRPGVAREAYRTYGSPEDNPEFWAGLSARTYFDRISDPVLAHHGRQDATCPFRWATETQDALEAAGADATLVPYPGEDHVFYNRWSDSMDRTIDFIRKNFRAASG
jgi:uncharacterized protein